MNWSSFIPDVLVAVIGSGLAVSVAIATFFHQQRDKNRQLVRNLADDLASRRAFEVIAPQEGLGGDEQERCRRSIEKAKSGIASIRDQIAPNSALRDELQEMVLACVDYKDRVEYDPELWQFSLMELREDLARSLRTLATLAKISSGSLPLPGTIRATRDAATTPASA
jgi:hypothetical protein